MARQNDIMCTPRMTRVSAITHIPAVVFQEEHFIKRIVICCWWRGWRCKLLVLALVELVEPLVELLVEPIFA